MAHSLEHDLASPQLSELDRQSALVHWSRKERLNEIFRGFLKPTKESHGVKEILVKLHGPPADKTSLLKAANSGNRVPKSRFALWLKLVFLKGQYNWAYQHIDETDTDFLVIWNGIKGHRRLLADAAREKSIPVVYFEESPLPGRVSVDFEGVNYGCSLPRRIDFYHKWAEESGADLQNWRGLKEQLVPRQANRLDVSQRTAPQDLADENFIFCPLQVPGDSQITIYGDWIRSIDSLIDVLAKASEHLPEGWHLRVKEHPSARDSFAEKLQGLSSGKFRIDNETNTFEQVAASKAVLNVNSSVGLQAFFFDKPVIALGHAFYAFDGLANKCSDEQELSGLLANPEFLTFDQSARDAFMSYLDAEFYPYEQKIVAGEYVLSDALKRESRRLRLAESLES